MPRETVNKGNDSRDGKQQNIFPEGAGADLRWDSGPAGTEPLAAEGVLCR